MDKFKFRDINYVQGETEATKMVNDKRFKKMTLICPEDSIYECEMRKRKISVDLPIQLALTILQYSKLRMLKLYYNYIDYFISRKHYQLIEMDTDALYWAISGPNMDTVIKKEKKKEYKKMLYGNCNDNVIEADDKHYVPRQCCIKHKDKDCLVLGIFKEEWKGQEIVALNSKCYCAVTSYYVNEYPLKSYSYMLYQKLVNNARKLHVRYMFRQRNISRYKKVRRLKYKSKISTKGLSRRCLPKSPIYIFRRVLFNKEIQGSTNKGFIFKNNNMYTYSQYRAGLSFLYLKRKVCDDLISTEPLRIIIDPHAIEK
jgi:hypothetical protein